MASPFWDFSVAVYGASAVEGECLTLQDQFGIDVNLILLCAFVGAAHGVALTPDDIASARAPRGAVAQRYREFIARRAPPSQDD